MSAPSYALGLDFGTGSVRALIVDIHTGAEVGTAVSAYPSGEEGVIISADDPNLARQNPYDYLRCMSEVIRGALADARRSDADVAARIVGIGVDTTGSSPMPVDASNQPLANDGRPDTMVWLWKDHTSFAEAAEITAKAAEQGQPYLAKCGGVYSSEWFWSKALRCLRVAPDVIESAASWVEIADWIPSQLAGISDPALIVRGVCQAGHKAMYSADWGGLPSEDFLHTLDPRLAALRSRLYTSAAPSNQLAGRLSSEWAADTGLPEGIPIAVGALDAHFGAVGGGIRDGVFVKIMGTSTCDIAVVSRERGVPDIPGLCGIVDGSVIPGMIGLEAGQSAVGDIFNWFVREFGPLNEDGHRVFAEQAAKLRPGESGVVALDWNNGNRTVLVNPLLTGLLVGQTLHTTPAEIYRAMIEATAFGARKIIERMVEYGVPIEAVINCGGIAEKSPLAMQIYADVCNRPMHVSGSPQTCAKGAAIFGAVVAGAHATVEQAQAAMAAPVALTYMPNPSAVAVYEQLYQIYTKLHDAFGIRGAMVDLSDVMPDLIALRQSVRRG
ncbi:MAG: ribulokinase [Fimbriimonadaceae bacterium]